MRMQRAKISFVVVFILNTTILGGATAKADGLIEIENYVDSIIGLQELTIVHYDDPGITDGYDSWDSSVLYGPGNRCHLYSDISDIEPVNNHLSSDYRLNSSVKPYTIRLLYNGTLGSNTPNHLVFYMPYIPPEWDYIFGNKPIIFTSDLLPYGQVVDARRIIAQNGGVIPLVDVPAGSYSFGSPYGSATLTIGTRLLSDLDDSNEVNFEDFAIFSEDWQKGPGQYVADICGPNGIPDGYVDRFDLGAFCDDYLKDVNDPNTW